ncbi:TonB-dependent receptor [Sphingobium sp. H39-3-25]|uniref:TonB-dependent receptor n=1 Tax=Sphingobium arseniciresistens TaxID=3030834 RepID=UPI0023B9F668|nr:TonB-dependent receptor [Sphingobium arseniciresistens]
MKLSRKAIAALLPLLYCTTAYAQAESEPVPAAQEGLGDIVVTANKRPEPLQKAAVAVSVLTGDDLLKSGTGNVAELSKIAPGLNLSTNANSTLIAIRGVSSRDYSEIGDPAVAINIDGAYIQRAVTLNASMFDISRVEVLRGPQGTLYGRNATGGAINIVTAKPVHAFAASASAEAGNYDSQRFEAMINLPVTDTLAVRAAGLRSYHEGYTDNGTAGRGDDEDVLAGRLSLQFDPTSALSATLTGEVVRQRGIGPVRLGVPFTRTPDGYMADVKSNIPSSNAWDLDKKGFNNIDVQAVRGTISYDFGPASLTYTGAFRHAHVDHDEDYEGTAEPGYGFPQNSQIWTTNHELRLVSAATQPFTYQLGVFYFKELEHLDSAFTEGPYDYAPDELYDYYSQPGFKIQTTSKAAFAQFGYEVLPDFKLEAGIRYTKDTKTRLGQVVSVDPAATEASGELVITGTSPQNSHASFGKVTYHLGANYQLTPTNMVYAKFDTGYKAGGFTEVAPYDPETIKAWEIGSKNRFAGNRIQANISAFYYKYQGQQISQFIDNQLLVANAGRSRMYGAELETTFAIDSVTRFTASVAWLNAKFEDFLVRTNFVASTDGNGNAQLAGNRPVQSPAISINSGLEHDFTVFGGKLNARVQTQFQSASHLSIYNYAPDVQEAYTRTDVVLSYAPDGSSVRFSVFGRNLENKRILTAATPNFTGNWLYQFAAPRTYGARFSVTF